jgi:hypothetical protein
VLTHVFFTIEEKAYNPPPSIVKATPKDPTIFSVDCPKKIETSTTTTSFKFAQTFCPTAEFKRMLYTVTMFSAPAKIQDDTKYHIHIGSFSTTLAKVIKSPEKKTRTEKTGKA